MPKCPVSFRRRITGIYPTTFVSDQVNQDYTASAVIAFTEVPVGIEASYAGRTAWGDYNNDGQLDLAISGDFTQSRVSAKIYQQQNGVFSNINAGLSGVSNSAVAWADYDSDGDIDLAISGETAYQTNGVLSQIYRNDNGQFSNIQAPLLGRTFSSIDWGDCDNDGDLDMLLCGSSTANSGWVMASKVYKNQGNGTFVDSGIALTGMAYGEALWGDYDNDGDLDILSIGASGYLWGAHSRYAKLYRNDGQDVFTEVASGLPAMDASSAAWADFDNDGDLDLTLAGYTGTSRLTAIYRNNNGTLTDIGANLIAVNEPSIAWGDCDNDGDLDLVISGYSDTRAVTQLYRNDGVFTAVDTGLIGVCMGSAVWGDYDNGADLDMMVCGTLNVLSGAPNRTAKLYRNDTARANAPPSAPGTLSTVVSGGDVSFSWSAASDAQTSSPGLSYNLRVGTARGKDDISCGMADASGPRRLPATGNTQKMLGWTLKRLQSGTYYWSVQAIDATYAGSAWAEEQTFWCCPSHT